MENEIFGIVRECLNWTSEFELTIRDEIMRDFPPFRK